MDTIAGGWREHNNSPFTSISPCKFPFNDRTPERSNVIEEKASRTKENQVSVGIFRLKEALAIVRTNYSLSITCIKLHKFWNHHCARSCRVFPLDWFTVLFPFFLTNHVIIARIPPILAKKRTDRWGYETITLTRYRESRVEVSEVSSTQKPCHPVFPACPLCSIACLWNYLPWNKSIPNGIIEITFIHSLHRLW